MPLRSNYIIDTFQVCGGNVTYGSRGQLENRGIYTIGYPAYFPDAYTIQNDYISNKLDLSIIIPVYNEEENILEKYQ